MIMIFNYLKLAIRSARKKWGYTLLNVVGLSTGIACFVLIALFVRDEFTFDRFHEKGSRIYRMKIEIPSAEIVIPAPNALARAVQDRLPHVEVASPLGFAKEVVIKLNDELVSEEGLYHVNPEFLNIFDLPLKFGDPKTALDAPNKLILSAEMSEKYFPNTNPVGETFRFESEPTAYVISGVLEVVPNNSSIRPAFLVNFLEEERDSWRRRSYMYVLFQDEQPDLTDFNIEVSKILEEQGQENHQPVMEAFEDMYLNGKTVGVKGDLKTVNTLAIVGVLILLLACINYVNLSTARMFTRAGEIGVRKVLGADRKEIRLQFLGETMLLVFVAVFISAGLVEGGLLFMNELTAKPISLDYLSDPFIIPFFIILVPAISLFAGLYPSMVLSSFKPARVLKNSGKIGSAFLRKSLIAFQFAITLVLIVSTLIMKDQVSYFLSYETGLDREEVIVLNRADFVNENYQTFKNELKSVAGVLDVTGGPSTSATGFGSVYSDFFEGGAMNSPRMDVDLNYIQMMGIALVQGRNFKLDSELDYFGSVIINESAARAFNFENPIGEKLGIYDFDKGENTERTIIGVTKDFVFNAKSEISTIVIVPSNEPFRVSLKIEGVNVAETMAQVKEKWNMFSKTDPFGYAYLDDEIQALYLKEKNYSQLFTAFTMMAILIAVLGLTGLSAFTAQLRLKEIGIRKVLGASISSLLKMLMKGYLGLIIVALLVAIPLSYMFMSNWLSSFANRVDIDVAHYLLGFLIVLVILVISVFSQSIKAALRNPVEILKDE